jgi:hypothetical protein
MQQTQPCNNLTSTHPCPYPANPVYTEHQKQQAIACASHFLSSLRISQGEGIPAYFF